MPKDNSEAVKTNNFCLFITLAIKESVLLSFINNSFAACSTSDARAEVLALSFL